MLNLQEPRVVDLLQAGRHYRLHFRRITDADYRGYYERITDAQERGENNTITTEFDSSAARVWLVENTLTGVEGYSNVPDAKNLAPLLPLKHKLAAADFLLSIGSPRATSADGSPITSAPIALAAEETVELALPRGWTCADDGASVAVTGLRHFFKTPSAEHLRKLRLAQSRSVIEGRTGRTRNLPSQPVAMEIYDELIARVEGYDGLGEASTSAAIASAMDGLHKVASVLELFDPTMEAAAK